MTWFSAFFYSLHSPSPFLLYQKGKEILWPGFPHSFILFIPFRHFSSTKKAKKSYDLVFRILLFSSFPFAISPPPKRQKNIMIWLPYSLHIPSPSPLPKKARKLHGFISRILFFHHFRSSPLSSFSFPVFLWKKICYTMFWMYRATAQGRNVCWIFFGCSWLLPCSRASPWSFIPTGGIPA